MKRRAFLSTVAGAAVAHGGGLSADSPGKIPIIDTHIHLFDVSRPQGVPWPPRDSPIYKTALPERLRKLAAPHGVVGAIEIECSSWLDDNQWVLDVAAKDTFIVGTIGNLAAGKPDFRQHLDRFHKNPLFRVIRYGNIGSYDLSQALASAAFLDDVKVLPSLGLVLDTANPDPKLMHAVVQLSDRIPNLKIIIDHLPELAVPEAGEARKSCLADLQLLGQRPQVFGKISGIVRVDNSQVPLNVDFYRDRLNLIWETFGPDRLLYGSDWPNSDQWAGYDDVFRLAHEFISTKGHANMEKYYFRNSQKAYGWIKRDASQNCSACEPV